MRCFHETRSGLPDRTNANSLKQGARKRRAPVWFIRTVPDRLLRADPRRAAQRTLLEPTMSDEYVASARDLSGNQRHLQSRHQHASFRSRLRSFPVPRICQRLLCRRKNRDDGSRLRCGLPVEVNDQSCWKAPVEPERHVRLHRPFTNILWRSIGLRQHAGH